MSWNIGGDGGNSFPFDKPGDTVTGLVKNLEVVPQTDIKTGAPEYWPDGRPKTMYRITLQTELRNDDGDDGMRSIYVRGSNKPESKSMQAAVREAVKAVKGDYDLEPDGKLTVQYTGDGARTQVGFNPPKQYAAWYERPAMTVGTPPPAPTASTPSPTPAGAAAPAPAATIPSQPAAATAGSVSSSSPAAAEDPQIALLRAAGVSDEKLREMGFAIPAAPAAADVIALHPQGAALRAAGLTDEQIRNALGISA